MPRFPEGSVSTMNDVEFFHRRELSLLPSFVLNHLLRSLWTHGSVFYVYLYPYAPMDMVLIQYCFIYLVVQIVRALTTMNSFSLL